MDLIQMAKDIVWKKQQEVKAEKKIGERKPASAERNLAILDASTKIMLPFEKIITRGIHVLLERAEAEFGNIGRSAVEKEILNSLPDEYFNRLHQFEVKFNQLLEQRLDPIQETPIEAIVNLDPFAAFMTAEYRLFTVFEVEE